MVKDKFPLGLTGILHLGDKVLELHKFGNLVEVYPMETLEDFWSSYEKSWEINVFNNGEKYVLYLYVNGEYGEFLDIKLEIE